MFAHVTDAGTGELVTIDLGAGRVVHRLPVGALARHVTLDPASTTLWTALGFSAREIVVVDVADERRPRVAAGITPPYHARDVVFSPNGRRVWVTSGDEPRIGVWDAAARKLLFMLEEGPPSQHIAFTARAAT
jgi:hypothetical protein